MKFKKTLSAAVVAAMLCGLAPASMAVEDTPAPEALVPLTDPTSDRIFCVVNDLRVDEFGELYTDYYDLIFTDDNGDPIKYSDYFNGDGTLTDKAKEELSADAEMEEIDIVIEDVEDIFRFTMYIAYEMISVDAEEAGDGFAADFPDFDAFYEYALNELFGGNFDLDVLELAEFTGGLVYGVDENGYIYSVESDWFIIEDGEYDFYAGIYEFIAPTGAYLKPRDEFGGYRNVFLQLKDQYEAGEIDNVEALALLTGFTPDEKGFMTAVEPVYEYYYDADGNVITDAYELDLVNDDLTIGDSGLSYRDYAIAAMGDIISDAYSEMEGAYGAFIMDLYLKYAVTDDSFTSMESLTALLDEYIAELRAEGYTDEDIAWDIATSTVDTDMNGIPVKSKVTGDLLDADGNKIHIDSVMDAEGGLLTGAEVGRNVQVLLGEFIETMSLDALLKGDANNDGKVALMDVAVVLQSIAKWEVESDDAAADVNGDGTVNLSDAALMLQYIADWDVAFEY